MSEHLTQNQMIGYAHRTLSLSELLSSSDHLGDCDLCRKQVERVLGGDSAYLAFKAEVFSDTVQSHLSLEQTSDYVDGTIAFNELAEVKGHLVICEQCTTAITDLQEFKKEIINQMPSTLTLENRRPTLLLKIKERLRKIVKAIRSLFRTSPMLVYGSVLSILLLTITASVIWRMIPEKKKTPEITQTVPFPAESLPPSLPAPTPEGTGKMILAQLNDGGGQIVLERNGKLSGIEQLPRTYQRMVEGFLANQKLVKSPLLAGLTPSRNSKLRGDDDQSGNYLVIEPVGKVSHSDHPTFRWSRLDGATSYVVEIYNEKFALIMSSPQLTNELWTPSQSLRRGDIYSWQVKAVKDGQEFVTPRAPAPQAKFRILDQPTANELTQAQRVYPSSHLILALLYAQAGLLDEAERECRVLQKANLNSALVQRLLDNVRALRN